MVHTIDSARNARGCLYLLQHNGSAYRVVTRTRAAPFRFAGMIRRVAIAHRRTRDLEVRD